VVSGCRDRRGRCLVADPEENLIDRTATGGHTGRAMTEAQQYLRRPMPAHTDTQLRSTSGTNPIHRSASRRLRIAAPQDTRTPRPVWSATVSCRRQSGKTSVPLLTRRNSQGWVLCIDGARTAALTVASSCDRSGPYVVMAAPSR
jgi:hypothetical protein